MTATASHSTDYFFSHIECVRLWTEVSQVPTNLAIDDRLIEEAQKLGKHRTKKDTVNAALGEYINRRKQLDILPLFGTIEYDEKRDYRRERRAKRR
jgi:Arc/MetJ family transcription regulator